jgi:putative methyltransferase (TIGR04325 family)
MTARRSNVAALIWVFLVIPRGASTLVIQKLFSKTRASIANTDTPGLIFQGELLGQIPGAQLSPYPEKKGILPRALHLIKGDWKNRRLQQDGDYSTWNEAEKNCEKVALSNVLDRVLAATLKIQKGESNERGVFSGRQRFNPYLISVFSLAAVENGGRLDVLDFGGSLGISYFESRDYLRDIPALCWSIVEFPSIVEAGKKHFQTEELAFYESLDKYLQDHSPNVIVASGVLQYLPDPWSVIARLLGIGAQYVLIARTGTAASEKDVLTVQHVPERIYLYEHPAWWLSEANLLSAIKRAGYECVHLFEDGHKYSLQNADVSMKGFICRIRH